MAPLEIIVTGSGDTLRPAERAILVLQATSQELDTAAEASAIVTSTANTIREAIEPHCPQDETTGRTKEGAAIAHYSMSTMDTNSHSRQHADDKTKYYTTYSARADFHIKFADFRVLNTLATQFSAMQNVKIQRINWMLTDVTLDSIKSGARKLAAQDAIQRARDYAEVFGGVPQEDVKTRVKAVHVKENNYYQQSTKPQLHYGKGVRMSQRNQGSSELAFQPEDVRLTVSVDGKFVVEED